MLHCKKNYMRIVCGGTYRWSQPKFIKATCRMLLFCGWLIQLKDKRSCLSLKLIMN